MSHIIYLAQGVVLTLVLDWVGPGGYDFWTWRGAFQFMAICAVFHVGDKLARHFER